MWNRPTKQELEKIPKLYATEKQALQNKTIYLHFFIGGTDWYIAEYCPEEQLFFGYTILNNDAENGEWGYISFEELQGLKLGFVEIDKDLYWKPKKASEIKEICKHNCC